MLYTGFGNVDAHGMNNGFTRWLDSANVPLLLRLWAETPAEDTYLIHTLRMALRDNLKCQEIFTKFPHPGQPETKLHRLLDVTLGVRNAPSAEFVLSALKAGKYDPGTLACCPG